jgi:hypothetical protein
VVITVALLAGVIALVKFRAKKPVPVVHN